MLDKIKSLFEKSEQDFLKLYNLKNDLPKKIFKKRLKQLEKFYKTQFRLLEKEIF